MSPPTSQTWSLPHRQRESHHHNFVNHAREAKSILLNFSNGPIRGVPDSRQGLNVGDIPDLRLSTIRKCLEPWYEWTPVCAPASQNSPASLRSYVVTSEQTRTFSKRCIRCPQRLSNIPLCWSWLTDQEDPMYSYLPLSDGPLAVETLSDLKLNSRNPFLAYLSISMGHGEN